MELISANLFKFNIPKEILNDSYHRYQLKVVSSQGTSRVIHCADKRLRFKYNQSLLRTNHTSGLEVLNNSSNFIIQSWILVGNKLIIQFTGSILKNIHSVTLSSKKMSFKGRIFASRKKSRVYFKYRSNK